MVDAGATDDGYSMASDDRFWMGRTVLVAGASGLIGRALMRALQPLAARVSGWSTADGDLREPEAARRMIDAVKPDVLFLIAGRQGGVAYNLAHPVAFLEDNALIGVNVIRAAARGGVSRLVHAGTTAVYSPQAVMPYREADAGAGPFDPTHESYALAKLVATRLCSAYSQADGRAFTSALLTNVYGPGGSFATDRSTVAAGLVSRAVEAKRNGLDELVIWGSGRALRDLMHVDDVTRALICIAEHADAPTPLNVCSGLESSIREIALTAVAAAGFKGRLSFDASRPEGVLRRVADPVRLFALGFRPRVDLKTGLGSLVADYLARFPHPAD
jgi:GDP-L-fucose synthase